VKDISPLVSIAVPVYNGSNYMRDAIDSVLTQTYSNFEVLVINDGSQDGSATEDIAKSYGDRIRYFSKPNGGVASALNLALEESKGEYFCWLSHDDIYLPEKVAKEMEKLLSLQDTNAVVFCDYAVISPEGKYLHGSPKPYSFPPHQATYHLILSQWLHCCTILAPKSLYIENGKFREDLPTTQDYDLLVKIGLKYPFVEISDVLLKARSHPEQGSLLFGHIEEIEHFFEENIPLLSAQYMSAHFTWRESVEAFLALGQQMRDRYFANAVLIVAKQLIHCETQRAEPEILWQAIHQLTVHDYPNAHQHKNKLTNQISVPLYKQNPLKIMARRILSPNAWITLRDWRDRIRQVLISVKQNTQPQEVQIKTASLNFEDIYKNNGFEGTESLSGGGSSLFQTRIIREEIPKLLKDLHIKHILDVPCGDWNWMHHLDITNFHYTGGDIVPMLIDKNNKVYGNEKCDFKYINIITGPIPKADLILCRDCLVHLNFRDGLAAIEQFRKSGAQWLLTTTFTERDNNIDLYDGNIWRPLNLEKYPYNLPKADRYINEGCTEGDGLFTDKCLGLWKLN
jgi:glycosyltransferase involved in cell wall biosynthesis